MVTFMRTLWTTILVVFLLHTVLGEQTVKSQNSSNDSCSKQRKILTGPSGLFSDGVGDYPEDSHCEWLIKANRSQQFITLTFLEMETECSYDHVFVYHGDSYNSPLLGSFSGRTLPPPITVQSDAMLVLLYSDTNYVRNGFTAVYDITDCPQDCNERGQCIDNICHCDALWSGSACDIPLCPNDCGINEHTGDCDRYQEPPQCMCNEGYSGESCSLPESNQNGGNSWHLLTRDKTDLSPRAGLAGAYLSHVDRFYLFGGFTFGKLLGDLLAYDFIKNRWQKFSTQNGPSPRSGHAISIYARNFVLYGGEMENGILSDELWLYNVAKKEWQLEAISSKIRPPALTKHSLTLVEGKWLYLFGGSLQDGSFSSAMYRINLNEGAQWEKIEPTGGKELERRIVGHSAVYHAATKSLFIYGGITVDYARFSRLSNQIHAFHIEKRYWTHLAYPKRGNYTPLERAFHTAAIVGDYLVVYGGYIHQHSHEELCYDNEIYLYHLGCHRWVNFASLNISNSTMPNPVTQGVFAHAMGVRKGHTLLIAGGYSGMTRGTFLAYVLPPVVTTRGQQLSASACSRHKTKQSCLNYTTCSWCSQNNEEFCLDITEQDKCKSGTFSASSCPGLCPALKDCHSCLIWGEPSGPNAIGNTDTMDPFLQPTCSWCVQAAQCHPIHDPPEACKSHSKNSDSKSELNWWGPNGTNITTVAECRTKDFRPGLTLLKYRHPVNFAQPDGLSFINQTAEDLRIQTEFSREREGLGGGINIATFLGFIHPFGVKHSLRNTPQMLMDSSGGSGGRAIFQMSNDSKAEHLEIIANRTMSASMEKSLHRPSGQLLFPIISPEYKYLINFTMILPAAYNETSTMKLKWNTSHPRENVIKISHLEPYSNGSCYKHDNCLACLSDAACGWCQQILHCVQRSVIDSHYPFCHGGDKYIITIPENCPLCSNYIYCEDCTKVHHCEWLVEEAHCGRRGRFDDAVRHPDLCPNPCHLRLNCTSCLGDPGRCAWCEETHSCFLFATYTTSFMFGRCREWVDEDRNAPSGVTTPGAQCRDCNRHSKCESCLKDLSCGWCGNRHNPTTGVCVQGDFSGPYFGECEAYVAQSYPDVSSLDPADWSYSSCPDVEECQLGLHDCHPNATCINTLGSYICTCNAGFKKTGPTSCTRTCSPQCVHGNCSETPDYVCNCELGWTGPDCSINCGCNNHSNCSRGVDVCDECQDWTEGKFCENCRPGSFGDATTAPGCKECNCNSHGNASAGYCNSTSGVCYCLHNTEGPHCDFCKAGYYGDPRDGGHCFSECQTRGIITNVQEGLLGSQAGVIEPTHCLWILTVHPVLNRTLLRDSFKMNRASIQLTILPDMKIKCPHNYLYVYDGLPKFISVHHQGKLLGAYCGINISKPLVAIATSGFMTIYFKRTDPAHGFNATYHRLECPHSCNVPNRLCHADRCQCRHSYAGSTCNKQICPNECSSHLSHGECQQMYGNCFCYNGYGGKDCSVPTNDTQLLWTKLFDPETVQLSQHHLSEELPRAGHILLASKCAESSSGCLWVFGGYSLTHGNLNDMYKFEIRYNTWKKVTVSKGSPPERRFHCAAMAKDNIYIYGGLGKNEVLGDFWKFSTSQSVWTELKTLAELPALVGSSLTTIEDETLILIGGFSYNYGFFEKVFEYILNRKEWRVYNSSGAAPVGIYGHTASYHQPTKSLYLFGGVIYNADHATVSDGLYALHYPSGRWSRLPQTNPGSSIEVRPLPTALHAAASSDNYLVITGGRGGKDNEVTHKTYAYLFKCNFWLPLDTEKVPIVVGDPLLPVTGISAVWWSGHMYIFGGFNGQMNGELTRLTLPSDLCSLFPRKRSSDCIQHTGCSHCSVYENGVNQTFCYSQHGIVPPSCSRPKGSADITDGTDCTSEWIERRECYQYTTCIDCTASWPSHWNAKQVCQWCSNCQDGRCVPAGTPCEEHNNCQNPIVVDPSFCPSRHCLASDCYKCINMPMCIWTRQVERSSERSEELNAKPIFDWTCVRRPLNDGSGFGLSSIPPLPCPPGCNQHQNCSTCLDSAGGEGGWHECRWSEMLQKCLSPNFELLQCEGGSCGAMLIGSSSSCSVPCSQHTQAAHCLSYPHCGWCAFTGRKVDGRGLCMEGGILKTTAGVCHKNEVKLTGRSLPDNVSRWLKNSEGASWSYLKRPPENECLNNHHNCNEEHEECVDKEDGFECRCKAGYSPVGKQCKPNCTQGCFSGTCVKPDTCKCNFGYVGHNCSIQCDCNGHSNCKGPLHLNTCLECHNNTQGSQCQQCKPLFVGNPVNGGKCIPCREYCNGHSDICLGELLTNVSLNKYLETVKEGPQEGAICHNCQNNTEGNRCEQCVQGFFKEGDSIKEGCRPCECHGHGDMCNVLNGENCNCQNNTENDRQCNNKNSKNMVTPCWKLQCSKCKEYFLGAPTHGHQCYRHMFLDKDYCFDPNTQEECNRRPSPLLQGRTVFFAVQPRYMNVDIRVIVDVTEGGADFYFSAREDTFVVDVNKSSGIHYVSVDRKYGIDINSDAQFYHTPLVVKDKKLNKREVKLEETAGDSANSNDSYPSSPLKLHEVRGRGLTTYVTITDPQEFLCVRRLQNRLVITIPQQVYDLRSTRFYMLLHGVGSKNSDKTYGSLFFRQDQTRIDLFVFFSVFFSCFFLFLAICVVIWKVKQAFDIRRARLLHAAEMKHMASRPFSSIIMLVEEEPDEYDFYPYSPCNFRKKHKYKSHLGRDSPKVYSDERCGTRPIAIEPISNGIAALVTVLIQLPGGMNAPVRLSLASALITVRGLSSHGNIGIRAPRRRRTSHVTL